MEGFGPVRLSVVCNGSAACAVVVQGMVRRAQVPTGRAMSALDWLGVVWLGAHGCELLGRVLVRSGKARAERPVWFGTVGSGAVRHGQERIGTDRFGIAGLGLAVNGLACFGKVGNVRLRCDRPRRGGVR